MDGTIKNFNDFPKSLSLLGLWIGQMYIAFAGKPMKLPKVRTMAE